MATRPTLGGTELPYPSAFSVTRQHRGSSHVMANGAIVYQYTATTDRRRFVLTFTNIPASGSHSMNNVRTAWDNFPTDADGQLTFLSPENESVTVTKDPQADSITFNAVPVAGDTIVWTGTMTLLEV